MSHIQSHHGGTEETHNTFLVILKVHGDSIHLWPRDKMKTIGETHSFRISCHNVETHSEHPSSDIQVFVLSAPGSPTLDSCTFQDQHGQHGEEIKKEDLVIFMTGPVSSARKASYALDLAVSKQNASIEDLNKMTTDDEYERIGAAYIYLDPQFSSQGIQKTPIISTKNQLPIGQIQVDYLIVTNPNAFGLRAPKPEWLFNGTQLEAGHRGAGSGRRMDLADELLENTIASFNYAHRHGADMCELDVVVSADGVPVVYHDFDVDAVAAQQSSDQLGKFRVQVNQFTVKQLRDFRLLALHDGEGCPYTLNVPNQQEDNRPFPTLEEVLQRVDSTCGMNIEIKWPQLLEGGKMEAKRFREINDFVDKIISVVDRNAHGRRIVLESFDADLVTMLRLKQNKFPVIFLSQGMTDKYERYVDTRARSIWNGIYFAQAFDLAGLDLISEYYETFGKKLVDFIESHGLVARAWGDLGESSDTLDLLKAMGLQCITYDKIDQMKLLIRSKENTEHHQQRTCEQDAEQQEENHYHKHEHQNNKLKQKQHHQISLHHQEHKQLQTIGDQLDVYIKQQQQQQHAHYPRHLKQQSIESLPQSHFNQDQQQTNNTMNRTRGSGEDSDDFSGREQEQQQQQQHHHHQNNGTATLVA